MMPIPSRLGQRGVALPLALFTLVIAAVMITAVFYVGRLEQRMGNNSVASTQAFEAAETGVATIISGWDQAAYNGMPIGGVMNIPTVSVGSNATYTVTLRRLNPSLFLVQVEGRFLVAGKAVTRRQVARIVRLEAMQLEPHGALTTRLGLEVTDNAEISGADHTPAGWGGVVCFFPAPITAAIVDSAGMVVTNPNCAGMSCLTGVPQIQTSGFWANSSVYNNFGNETFAGLASVATKIVSDPLGPLAATTDPGAPPTCRVGEVTNWGDPINPSGTCGSYFPLIYAPGDLTLSDGWGQGLLLVQGNLTVTGTVHFHGIIIVQGAITITGGEILGAVMTNNVAGLTARVGGTAEIKYSRCAIDRAVTGASQPNPLRERSWVQLY